MVIHYVFIYPFRKIVVPKCQKSVKKSKKRALAN